MDGPKATHYSATREVVVAAQTTINQSSPPLLQGVAVPGKEV